eukprot:4264088-Pyramimonas_sp.AAC.1
MTQMGWRRRGWRPWPASRRRGPRPCSTGPARGRWSGLAFSLQGPLGLGGSLQNEGRGVDPFPPSTSIRSATTGDESQFHHILSGQFAADGPSSSIGAPMSTL